MDACQQLTLSLRVATDADRAFSEALSRDNMAGYRRALGVQWDPARYAASWQAFENLVLLAGGERVGVLRLCPAGDALEVRDLQVLPGRMGQGIGGWAIGQALALARARGITTVALRVYADNPARALYTRYGFRVVRDDGAVLHMARAVA